MRAFRKLTWIQIKLYLREPAAFFFTLVFPILLLLLFGEIFGNAPYPGSRFGYVDHETPALIVLILGTVAWMGLPIATATARELGILRRYRATPLPVRTYIAADLTAHLLIAALGALLLVATAWIRFDLRFEGSPLAVVLGFFLTGLSFFALGYLVGALSPTSRIAYTVGSALFFPMMFLSGAAFPVDILPGGLARLSRALPMTHGVELLQKLWFGTPWREVGTATAVLVASLAAGAFLSIRFFRWD